MKISRNTILYDHSAIGHFILSAIGEIKPEVFNKINVNSDEFEVCMTFNGVEVPIDVVINQWVERNNQGTKKEAVNLVVEKINELNDKIRQTEEEIKDKLFELKSDIGKTFDLQYDSWDDYFYENDDHA